MEKRGIAFTLIFIIIAIATFVIILLFLTRTGLTDNGLVDREVCKQSIIQRSTFTGPLDVGQDVIPIKCKSEKVCIGEDCDFGGNEDKKIKVDGEKRVEVVDVLIDKLAECHSMVGEGKLNFLPRGFNELNYCFPCSRIDVDDKVSELNPRVGFLEMYSRMNERKFDESRTYLEYLFNGKIESDVRFELEKARFEQNQEFISKGREDLIIDNIEDMGVDLRGPQIVMVQILPKSTFDSWKSSVLIGAGVTAVGVLLLPVGIGGAILAGAATTGVLFTSNYPDSSGDKYVAPTFYPYNLDYLRKVGCTSFEVVP